MLTEIEAEAALQVELPGIEVAARTRYRDLYLFRVVFPSASEADYDPFFSVDIETGEVNDFSVMHDGDINEIAAAFAQAQSVLRDMGM